MQLTDIITPERVTCGLTANSKKRALEKLSELIAEGRADISEAEVFESLLARERLGGTGVGHGVAIPHGRLSHGQHAIGAFVKLTHGVDFDASDNEPVDLLFALIVPAESTEEHLQVLALLATMFSDEALRRQARAADSDRHLYDLLTNWQAKH
ncbi:MAG TPA: PTS IIA-like nitrogen regulatory protein PtsN [Gammaproteobacteria bacterium]|nr:PTS IIA-like nitrogen regulatory protein PtsN [Gammaproteobacteria bacterium]